MNLSPVSQALRLAVDAGRTPGLVAAVSDRRGVVRELACGVASASTGQPMRTDAVFRVASMTKLVTSIAVMMLHEAGRLDLNDPLARHLPGFRQPGVLVSFDEATGRSEVRDANGPITIHHLLTHTSGLGYWFLNRELLLAPRGREFFDAPFLMHDPGARFSYGVSTDVLGQIIEPLSGLALDRFIAERIAAPLGMQETSFDVPPEAGRLAGLHTRRGGGFVDAPNEPCGDPPRGGGGLYTTARDYLALLRMMLNGGLRDDGERLLSADSVAAIASNQIGSLPVELQRSAFADRTLDFEFIDGTQSFGFSVLIETRDSQGGRMAGSYGWGGIYNTYFWVDPGAGLAAVLMMQLSPFCDPGCLSVYRAFERAVYTSIRR